MATDIDSIVFDLHDFGDAENEQLVHRLQNIAETSTDALVRDWAMDLVLFCEGNENGPLGMRSAAEIRKDFLAAKRSN